MLDKAVKWADEQGVIPIPVEKMAQIMLPGTVGGDTSCTGIDLHIYLVATGTEYTWTDGGPDAPSHWAESGDYEKEVEIGNGFGKDYYTIESD